jgi:hypothetical protein
MSWSQTFVKRLDDEYSKLDRPCKLRCLSGPPAWEWTSVLPIDIVYHSIDQLDPIHDRNAIKSLVLTSRELKAYCRPLLFETIMIGSVYIAEKEYEAQTVKSLHRLSILLQQDPEIANFFKNINIHWIPSMKNSLPLAGFQRYEAEALFSFILDRPLPEVTFISIAAHSIQFPHLAPCIQHSLLTLVSAPNVICIDLAMGSFPNTILEKIGHTGVLTLYGSIYVDPSRPQLPFTVDPHVAAPTILSLQHVPDGSLSLLLREGSPRFDTCNLRVLRLGHCSSHTYSARQNALVLRASPHLFYISLTILDPAGSRMSFFMP